MAKKFIDAEMLISELDASCMPIFEKGISGILGDEQSIADVIREQPAADVQEKQWISVKDRLPDEEQDVLLLIIEIEFYGKRGEKRKIYNWIYTGWYIDGKWATTYCFGHKYVNEESNDCCELTVTHWMPLPEPPSRMDGE